ncbi:hypothetical protein [Bradyrhizobium sp.]
MKNTPAIVSAITSQSLRTA